MASLFTENTNPALTHPLDLVEQIVTDQDWPFERFDEDEMAIGVAGSWCEYHICFSLRPELCMIQISCSFDMRISESRQDSVLVLFGLLNEKMWMGHFELCREAGLPVFRHSMPLSEVSGLTSKQAEDLIQVALRESERVYPALQFMLWGGKSPEQAVAAALLETVGEA